MIISLKERAYPLSSSWDITWQPLFLKKEWRISDAVREQENDVFLFFYFHGKFLFSKIFCISSNYGLFMEQYVDISTCWEMFVYSSFLMPLVSI